MFSFFIFLAMVLAFLCPYFFIRIGETPKDSRQHSFFRYAACISTGIVITVIIQILLTL